MTSNIGVPAQPEDENNKSGGFSVGDVPDFVAEGAYGVLRSVIGVPRTPAAGSEPVSTATSAVDAATTASTATDAVAAGAEVAAAAGDAAGGVAEGVASVIGGILGG
jgi:hypothetical protein